MSGWTGLYLQDAWYRSAWWLLLLVPVEWLYRVIVAVRRSLYSFGLLKTHRSACPVAVVGNVSVGGTGKTPTVIGLVEALASRGIRAGVVSRGYGSRNGSRNGARSDKRVYRLNEQSTVADCGDEMLMVYRRTAAPCAIAKRRAVAANLLAASGEVDIVLSDDGLQHYALGRDLEIVLYDADAAFGNGRCLPAGPLREPLSRLREADFVLARSDRPGADAVALVPNALVNVASGVTRPLDDHGLPREVIALAGVGQPALFFRQLRELGFRPQERRFPDHHVYTAADLECVDDQTIIMTEKDAVKCSAIASGNAWYLQVDAVLPDVVIDRVAALASPPQSGP